MRSALVGLTAIIASACQCGGYNLCDSVHCKTGFTCDVKTGLCRQDASGGGTGNDVGGGGGGGGAATGGGAVGGGMSSGGGGEVCNCSGNTPYCVNGTCVECRNSFDCMSGQVCDFGFHVCMSPGTGGGTGGGGNSGTVIFDDAGMTAHCLQTGGPAPQCTTECNRGFICVSGQCVLRGSTGPVQITLRFNQPEDLDLHVVEPLPDAGRCEIWYGNPNQAPDAGGFPFPFFDGGFPFPFFDAGLPFLPMSCGAKGWLDLDSNPACRIDNVDIENVIYPANSIAPSGTYKVRVDYYQDCSASMPVPYEVEVRANGQTRYYCGEFQPGTSDTGSEGSGVDVTSFTIP
jgi:hypothetical protein